jgi:membrane fusion protein (multidrug efflux system)
MNSNRIFSTILLGSGLFLTACGNKDGAKQQQAAQMQAQAMPVFYLSVCKIKKRSSD